MNDLPLVVIFVIYSISILNIDINLIVIILFKGFGVASKGTADCKHADPLSTICFHQADIGEYIRSEDTLL